MTREPNPEHIHTILDEVHDEYDANEFDEREPSVNHLNNSLNDLGIEAFDEYLHDNYQAQRQLLVELAATAVAIIASIDAEPGDTDE